MSVPLTIRDLVTVMVSLVSLCCSLISAWWWSVSGVGQPANILLCCSEHLVYEQDKLGNKHQIESPLPALTGAREEAGTRNNKENISPC